MQTFWLFSREAMPWKVPLTIGLSTFCYYCIHDWYSKLRKKAKYKSTGRGQYWHEHRLILTTATLVAMLLTPILMWLELEPSQWLVFIVLGIITVLYSFQILPIPGLSRWKDHRWLKITMLAGTWAALTVFIWWPWLQNQLWHLAGLVLSRFCFMLAICVPFDVRDTYYDRPVMGITMFDQLGLRSMHRLAIGCLMLSGLLLVPGFFSGKMHAVTGIVAIINLIATERLVTYTFKHPKEEFLYLLLDAQMIVQSALVGLSVLFT